jgi:hypothetical protein
MDRAYQRQETRRLALDLGFRSGATNEDALSLDFYLQDVQASPTGRAR